MYDHQFSGQLHKWEKFASEVDATCHKFTGLRSGNVAACAILFPNGGPCIVILPWVGIGGVGKRTYDLLLRHETAHCNGWANNHPSRP